MDIIFPFCKVFQSWGSHIWDWSKAPPADAILFFISSLLAVAMPFLFYWLVKPKIETQWRIRSFNGVTSLLFAVSNKQMSKYASGYGLKRSQVDALRVNFGIKKINPELVIFGSEQAPIWSDRGQKSGQEVFVRSVPGDGHPVEVSILAVKNGEAATQRVTELVPLSFGEYVVTVECSVDGQPREIENKTVQISNTANPISLL